MPLPAHHPLFEMRTPHYEPGGRDSKVFYYSEKAPNATRSRIILAILLGCCVLLLILIVFLQGGAEECEIQNKIVTMRCDEATTRLVNGNCKPRFFCGRGGMLGADGVCVSPGGGNIPLKSLAFLAVIPVLVLLVKPSLIMSNSKKNK